MAIDLVVWGFILGAIGTALSSALTLVQLSDRIRARSGAKEEVVKSIFKGILGPIRSLDQGFASGIPYVGLKAFLEGFHFYKNEILGAHHVLVELAPEIASELLQLIDVVDKETNGSWEMGTGGLVENDKFKQLAGHLGGQIYEWLSEHN